MNIEINRESKTHVYLQVMHAIKNAIIKNEVVSGYKLPPERKLADTLGVHRNTIIKAYKMLVDEGYVAISKQPKGYFVSYGASHNPLKGHYLSAHFQPFEYIVKDEFLHMNALFSRLFHTSISKKMISFATAMPSSSMYPIQILNHLTQALLENNNNEIYGYSHPQGDLGLREAISKYLEKQHILTSPSEITICSETYQAMDYLVKLVVSHGETVILEEPVNPDLFDLLTLLGAKVVTIPLDHDGMIVNCLENLILKYKPKFILTIPTFHNPSMTILSLDRRRELLKLSYQYNVPIVEINHDSSLRYSGDAVPSLKSMDTMGTVIYIDSFIFKIAPGIKVAYLVSSKSIAKKLSKMVEINQIFFNTLTQKIIAKYLNDHYIYAHEKVLRDFYYEKQQLTALYLKTLCQDYLDFTIPNGGVSIWCKLKVKVNQDILLLKAEESGISFAPGHLFYPYGNEGDDYLRISYSVCTENEIKTGIEKLSQVFKSVLERGENHEH